MPSASKKAARSSTTCALPALSAASGSFSLRTFSSPTSSPAASRSARFSACRAANFLASSAAAAAFFSSRTRRAASSTSAGTCTVTSRSLFFVTQRPLAAEP